LSLLATWRPMPLTRVAEAFDDPDWLFELKHAGFRALALIERYSCRLVSRRGQVFSRWPQLCEELAHTVKARHAVLDGEIVCLKPDGRTDFYDLLFRREWPHFFAFDLLQLEDEDLRGLPLLERKRRLKRLVPRRAPSRLAFVDHVRGHGRVLYAAACERDLEGVVAKWTRGRYHVDGSTTSWVKVKNPEYTQAVGRYEVFEERRLAHGHPRPHGAYRMDPRAARGW
jgi:bifunctional non-homologous end joining protein LigD